MSSNSSSEAGLSGALSSLNIGSNNESSNNEETGGATNDDNDIHPAAICANCGKEGDGDSMNICNKCDLVKYCNAACKKKHRSKHKKKCKKWAAELHDAQLFKEHPREECPICMLPLPLDTGQTKFKSCCGKIICGGYQLPRGLAPVLHNPYGNTSTEPTSDHCCREDKDTEYKKDRFVTKITISLRGLHYS